MNDIVTIENKIKQMIDELKGLCQTNGLSNQASEEVIVTSTFLYKFINDKFMANIKAYSNRVTSPMEDILQNKNSLLDSFYETYVNDIVIKPCDTIEMLANKTNNVAFNKLFMAALYRISNYPKNEQFTLETAEGTKKPLFTNILEAVEEKKRDGFAKALFGIIGQSHFDFSDAFKDNFDFYSTIFEYLIKDYNVAEGVYAEYFTPQAISKIIAKILVHMSPVEDTLYDVYDPSAGSGSLVLHLAHELGHGSFGNKAKVYTQDISSKSTRFLRLNLMLNGLADSLDNVIEGDTLLTPAHYNVPHEPSSGLKKFDYITSNPPFKTNFSSTRDQIEKKWNKDEPTRFFAGIPKVPAKKKDSMAIYLCFIQHILFSLKDDGKAAIVVPTGFLTAQSGIEKKVRKYIIDNQWLKGAISMPSNIFANTGTNVSVLFIDKSNTDGKVTLIDASKLGAKVKEGKNQRTVLSVDEVEQIENTFINGEVVDDFSVQVTNDDIIEKNYSLSAGQYFEIKIEYVELTPEEFQEKIDGFTANLDAYFQEGKTLEDEIKKSLGELKYE